MKILILLMSCNSELFIEQSKVSKKSLQRQIEYYNLTEYFKIYDYVGNSDKQYLENNSTIHLLAKDDKDHTYEKTIECFEYINNNFDYDYIFRTNTSTFVNVKLLYEFIKFVKPRKTIWCSELYSTNDVKCPDLYDIYPRGNGLLLSKQIINIIIDNKELGKHTSLTNIIFENQNMISDDACIGTIFNEYYGHESVNLMKSFMHGWYKSYDILFRGKGNSVCNWDNENISYDFISNFITIQLKDYTDKNNIQEEKFNELTDIILHNDFNTNAILNILAYSLNPSVFIGYFSDPPYIDYMTWYNFHFNKKLSQQYKL